MATELSICNSALIKLGAEPITALTDLNKRAKLCASQYPILKEKLLNEHPWNFAIAREVLVANSTTPAFGYSNSFDLPTDYIRALDADNGDTDYQREGEQLLANSDSIELRFILSVDEDEFTNSFAEALAFELAHDLSYSLVQSQDMRERLEAAAERSLAKARSFDAQEGTPREFTDQSFLNVRL